MQVDSLMAPQHPKKAITNIIQPITIVNIGASFNDWSVPSVIASVTFNFTSVPITINAAPAI